MTENLDPQKPEWFEIKDGDTPSAQVRKVNRRIPALAVLVTGAVIATGAFFANASEEKRGDDFAPAPSINQIDNTTGVNPDAALPNAATPNDRTPQSSNDATAPGAGVQDPSKGGVLPPHENGDDDGAEHGDRHEGDGGEHHKGGEHRERGTAPTIPSTTSGTASKSA